MVGIAALQKVLQLLLEEGVHIRDMRSIVECLAEHAATVTDPAELARRIRVAPGAGHRAADLRPGAASSTSSRSSPSSSGWSRRP